MKYCKYCGGQVADNAVVCVHCGSQIENVNSGYGYGSGYGHGIDDGTAMAIKILMILSCVFTGFLIIPLCWNVPMTVIVWQKLNRREPIGTGLKVCVLLFTNLIAGILLLCADK